MACPHRHDVVQYAVKKCPFLAQIAQDQGEDFARSVAVNPARPASSGPVFPESIDDFSASFRLFHGAGGVVPLIRTEQPGAPSRCPSRAVNLGCANSTSVASAQVRKSGLSAAADRPVVQEGGHVLAHAPFASLTSSFFRFLPGPGDFIARRRQRRQRRRDQDARSERRKPASGQSRGSSNTRASISKASAQRNSPGLHRWRQNPYLGGLIPLNAAGRLVCPPAVVAARAAVARLKTVQMLRPQSLPIKLLGVSAQCFAANIPAGMVREHTEKFSLAWVVAVHATVPFFAFMRKGVGMPKWAIVLTLASAVAGQAIGARLERCRLEAEEKSREAQLGVSAGLTGHSMELSSAERRGCPLLKTCSEISSASSLSMPATAPFLIPFGPQIRVA